MKGNCQYAHNEVHESESKLIEEPEEALFEFDKFDWSRQLIKANELERCSPTLTVINENPGNFMGVSIYGETNKEKFSSDCHFPGEVPSWFGIAKKKGTITLRTYLFTRNEARKAIELFIKEDYHGLKELYA